VTVAEPDALPPPATVNHDVSLDVVHAHPAVVVTCTATVSPAAEIIGFVGAIVNLQGAAAAGCDTVTAWPATVTVPVRAGPAFAAAVMVACPDALPPPATVSHGVPLDVVHAHPAIVVTCTATVSPAAEIVRFVGAIVSVQGAAAACDSVTAWPAMVTVPVRAGPAFAAAVMVACPDALPPPATVNHDVPLDVVHAHPAIVVT
jgi:hypothetical protein